MKKIGILFGQENSFPQAFVDRVEPKGGANKDIYRQSLSRIDKVMQAESLGYSVIIDRISQDVPFYRAAMLKNAAMCGIRRLSITPFGGAPMKSSSTTPWLWRLVVPVPKTVRSFAIKGPCPMIHTEKSFRNLAYPLDWERAFSPMWDSRRIWSCFWRRRLEKRLYQINSLDDLWDKYNQTKQYVMMLQEEIIFDDYFRCYCIGGKACAHYASTNHAATRTTYATNMAKPRHQKKLLETVNRLCH